MFRMAPASLFQEGCFPPCMCPMLTEQPVEGTFTLAYAGANSGIHTYAVSDINWRLPGNNTWRTTGAGKYSIGSPGPITVLQQRMELDLQVGGDPVQHFDSGWVLFQNNTGIQITVSMHGMYCWDRVFAIDAVRVPPAGILPYALQPGATYQRGCFNPCDCLLEDPRPLVGEFALIPLQNNPLFQEFAVVNVRWHVLSPVNADVIPIHGFGMYRVGGEVAVQQQLVLELWIGNDGPMHFDSGLVIGGGQFPLIDAVVSMNGMVCFDIVLHVIAKPVIGHACGGIASIPCDAGEFCKFPIGACCCDIMGICMPVPGGCPDVWQPVCGCNGVTYGNECEADLAGAAIAHPGECQPTCGGPNGATCGPGHFCKYPIGVCDPASGVGMCAPVPPACPTLWDPVCGCDGVTYSNECVADTAGAMIAHRGICAEICGGIAGIPCPPGDFCKFPMGTCNVADNLGVCLPVPGGCPDVWQPVCGCDGVTYSNECYADRAGIAVDHPGECAVASCAATRILFDSDLTYCPGNTKTVHISLTPPASASAVALEDMPPAGWIVTNNISNGGAYDPAHHKVKWGPFFPPFPAEVSYEVIPPAGEDGLRCFSGSISVDGHNGPICGDTCVSRSCCPRIEADRPQPPCPSCPIGDCGSCDASVCGDGQISLCEVIGYACAWLRGCNDDLSGVTRAAYVWRNGECYCWSDAEQNWIPADCSAPGSGCCAPTSGLLTGPPSGGAASVGTATVRVTPNGGTRGGPAKSWSVAVAISPQSGISAVAAEMTAPKGWRVANISDGGAWDDMNRKVKWGPFFDGASRTVSFDLVGSAKVPSEKPGQLSRVDRLHGLTGRVSFDGINLPIEGGSSR